MCFFFIIIIYFCRWSMHYLPAEMQSVYSICPAPTSDWARLVDRSICFYAVRRKIPNPKSDVRLPTVLPKKYLLLKPQLHHWCSGDALLHPTKSLRSPREVVANVLNCDIIESEFELHSHNCIHFRANALGKVKNSYIPPSSGLNSTTAVLLKG